jgi:hypothetical protein
MEPRIQVDLYRGRELIGRFGKAAENRLAPDHDELVVERDRTRGAEDVLKL